MKITKISLQGFRAFDESFPIDLGEGKNLLLYGENGSGKSSISVAIKRFFEERGDDITTHRNHFSPPGHNSQVHINIKGTDASGNVIDENVEWNDTGIHPLSIPANPAIAQVTPAMRRVLVDASRRAGFLDYRMMLRTHLLSSPLSRSEWDPGFGQRVYGVEPKGLEEQLFDLVSLVVLDGVRVTAAGGGETTIGALMRSVWKDWLHSRHKNVYASAVSRANAFNAVFNAKLPELEAHLAEFLKYFENHQLSVMLNSVSISWDKKTKTLQGAQLVPDITFRGKPVDDYHQFLNEARLSAIATCLFFAGVRLSDNDYDNPDYPRFIVLDDAMIGLDLQNRLPILRILNSDTFKHHQVFLFTHDRHWFNIAKRELGSSWLKAELYEGATGNGGFKPILISPSLSDFERAEKYFEQKDYAACANYLRKVCEAEVCRILPEHRRRHETASGEVEYIHNLQDLHTKLLDYLQSNGVDPTEYRLLDTVKAVILNPFSHADISSPLYTAELRSAFDLISSLQKVERKLVAKAEQELIAIRQDEAGDEWTYTVQIKEPLYALDVDGNRSFTKCEARPRQLSKNGDLQPLRESDLKLDKLYDHYCHYCKVSNESPYEDFKFENGESLAEKCG